MYIIVTQKGVTKRVKVPAGENAEKFAARREVWDAAPMVAATWPHKPDAPTTVVEAPVIEPPAAPAASTTDEE